MSKSHTVQNLIEYPEVNWTHSGGDFFGKVRHKHNLFFLFLLVKISDKSRPPPPHFASDATDLCNKFTLVIVRIGCLFNMIMDYISCHVRGILDFKYDLSNPILHINLMKIQKQEKGNLVLRKQNFLKIKDAVHIFFFFKKFKYNITIWIPFLG